MDDVLFDEPISARQHGWLVRAGVGMQLRDFLGTVDSDPKLRFEFEIQNLTVLPGNCWKRQPTSRCLATTLFTEVSRSIDKDAWFIGSHNGSGDDA